MINKKDWLKLFILNNCFRDRDRTHIGLKYNNKWYCISHKPGAGSGVSKAIIIPKSCLIMNKMSDRTEYLKEINKSAPNIVKETGMKIHKSLLENFNSL